MQNKLWLGVCAALAAVLSSWQANASGAARVSADYNTPSSFTCGIQEAVDSLQGKGGTVYIPEGVHILQNPVILTDGVKLAGSGAGTVLRKAPLIVALLAQDARKGQKFVVVEDASELRAGLAVVLGEAGNLATPWRGFHTITKIVDGNRVYLKCQNADALLYDYSVDKGARLMTHSMGIRPAANCIISDLSLDGAADAQMPEEAGAFVALYTMTNGIYPLMSGTRVERCRIYNWLFDGIGVNSLESVTVRGCDIFNNRGNGIHVGGGPRTIINQNNIYGNHRSGVYFCLHNRGLIVTENLIYENREGIGGINSPALKHHRSQDTLSIISNNIIYRNKGPGITSFWKYHDDFVMGGPRNFIISGNIIENNLSDPPRGDPLAGIVLVNAEDCIVTGNLVTDDRDTWHSRISSDVRPGDQTVRIPRERSEHMVDARFPGEGASLRIEDTEGGEEFIVAGVALQGREYEVLLKEPLRREYRADRQARIAGVKKQDWGILCVWDKEKGRNRGNIIANNIVSGNRVGGIFWAGEEMEVAGNLGKVIVMDESRPLKEQVVRTP